MLQKESDPAIKASGGPYAAICRLGAKSGGPDMGTAHPVRVECRASKGYNRRFGAELTPSAIVPTTRRRWTPLPLLNTT